MISRRATLGYVAPFTAFVGLMALERATGASQFLYPIRLAVVTALLFLVSRPYLPGRPSYPLVSVAIGAVVFAIWIAPDLLFGYRHYWLFENPITGAAISSAPPGLQRNVLFIILRAAGCTLLVPVLEELFWRGWLMRWLVNHEFLHARFRYDAFAFWMVVLLFASEHGPYWEVGAVAGIAYNWWVIRTGNLADAMLAHAVTNGLLSAYVLLTGQWQYWL
jgi:CAAX prenyl protease-like protein